MAQHTGVPCHAHYTDSEKILARNYTIKGKTPTRPRWVFSFMNKRNRPSAHRDRW